MKFIFASSLWKLWKLWKRLPCQIPIIQMRLDLMQNDHGTDTTDREDRPPESPSGDLEVTLEDVLPYLHPTRRPRKKDTTGR